MTLIIPDDLMEELQSAVDEIAPLASESNRKG